MLCFQCVYKSGRLANEHVYVEEIAITTEAQVRKLSIIMEILNDKLGVTEETAKWSVSRKCD